VSRAEAAAPSRLGGIFRFELAYQARRPWPWLMGLVLFVVCFLMTRDAAVQDALYEEFFVNAPFAIAVTTVVGGLLWLLLAPVIAGEAAARDVATSMHPLVYTAPLGRAEYLVGRFLAALVINALLLLAVQAGILAAVHSPGVNPELIGPFRPAAYLTAWAYLALPNAVVATAIQFAIALRSGRPMSAYLGSMLLVFMGFFVASLLFYGRGPGALLDPIGIRFVVEDIAHQWTTIERRTRLLAPEGVVLSNRLFWLAIAGSVAALSYWRFRFAHRAEGDGAGGWRVLGWLRRPGRRGADAASPAGRSAADDGLRLGISAAAPVSVPHVPRDFGPAVRARQTLAVASGSFRAVARSWAGFGFFVVIPLLTILVLVDQMVALGAGLIPTTGQVLQELTGPLTSELSRWVIVPLLTVFFAGELVWREREAALDEISDAAPVPDAVQLLGKLLGLLFVLAAFLACLMAAGMATQALLGHTDFDLGLYLTVLFGVQLSEFLLFAALAMAVHVLVGQKYVGHLAAIVLYVTILLAPTFGIEHNLLIFGAGPWWTYTEMSGLGPYMAPWLWFKLYWAAWALLLLVVARLLWVRGRESGFGVRLRLARRRLAGGAAWAGGLAVALILLFGGFVFYNTNVLNEYVTASDLAERQAEYERRYGRFADAPQPALTHAGLRIDIHPHEREVDIRGEYRLVNMGDQPIDSIHVATLRIYDVESLDFDRAATELLRDDRLGHRIYGLTTPLQPGDSMSLRFEVHVERRGFTEGGADASIVPNGTWFTQHWLPAIGYQPMRELRVPSQRRAQGLAARPVIPSLHDEAARHERAPGMVLDAVLSTDAGQVAVAPGALRRSWTEGDRAFSHYTTDGPIGGEWVFTSADYEVLAARWNDVDIRVFHDPAHDTHPPRMARDIQATLDYYTRVIGPYPYDHISVVEVPGDGVGMHADASMLSHGEGVTLLRDGGPGTFDMPFAVMAHEMAHQWAVSLAVVEGAPVIAEGVAWYYAVQAVRHIRGEDSLRRLMSFLRQPHPIAPIHRGEPLLRGLDPWMSYRKAPYALFALSEYMGQERVDLALRRLYQAHEPADAPLATTLDLYRELRTVAPDSMQGLLHDLFEVNAFWALRVERVRADPLPTGEWRVVMDVHARKIVVDSAGVETEVPVAEPIQIGVFGAREPGRHELSAPLYLAMHRVRPGEQTITLTVPERPVMAGIDPYHLLDWEEKEDDDNVEGVTIEEAGEE